MTFNKPDLVVAKIVATPTLNSWSQVYNAGGLFAVLSLIKESVDEENPLNILGKEILNSLEEEYYTLETKDLNSIKQAISITAEKIPSDISACFVVVSIINNILYAFLLGNGQIIIKRSEKLGHVITPSEEEKNKVVSASGFLENEDIVILQTKAFSEIIPLQSLKDSLDHHPPSEIAETLSPRVHEEENGAASAVIISYVETKNSPAMKQIPEESKQADNMVQEDQPKIPTFTKPNLFLSKLSFLSSYLSPFKERLNIKEMGSGLNHSKKVFLTIALMLIIILAASVFFAVKKQKDTQTQALFQSIYPQAEKKFNEGQSLIGLNENLAREDLKEAQKILNEAQSKFSKDSKEEKQILSLLDKTNQAIESASNAFTVDVKQVSDSSSALLNTVIANQDTSYVTQDDKNIYFLNTNGVSSLDKKTQKTKLIIKKDNWIDPAGIGVFFNNIYVLDKESSKILKFVGGTSKSNYFAASITPDLSNASSIAIDSSIWVLLNDGAVKKFTKGKPDDFNISGLDLPLSNPSRIFTNADLNKIYVLDNGNSRIVVLNKDGGYSAQYQNKILKDARDFEVVESSKKIYVLSQNKIYQIDME